MRSHGLEPGALKLGMNRFSGAGKSSKNKAGWCRLFDDGLGAVFGDWSTDLRVVWQAKRDKPYTQTEKEAFKRQCAEAKAQAEAEQKARQDEAAQEAKRIFGESKPASASHPYLAKKGIKPHGARIHNGDLLIPLRDGKEIISIQTIKPDGDKLFLKDGRVRGGYFSIGSMKNASALCLCEGFATGASIFEATGHPVAVAFNDGNLELVAKAMREKFPDVKIIVCADDDYKTNGNSGLTKATVAAQSIGGFLAVPVFGDDRPDGATDYNDLLAHRGLEAVAECIERAVEPEPVDVAGVANVHPKPLSDDTSILIAELAKLTPIEYDQQRETAAGKLGIRVATLDQEVKQARLANQPQATSTNGTAIFMEDVEPWPEPVDGVELLNELADTFKRYVTLPDFAEVLLALWVVFTYAIDAAIDAAFTAPILAITSPQKRCGKTTLLALLTQFVSKPLSASNITAAALFRSIEKWMPTLLVDEADTFLKDKEELRGVINAGHTRSTAYVIRTVGDDHEPTQFNVWGAKAIAMIGALPDTIADRSINVTMRRRRADEKIEKLRADRIGPFNDLARRCARWSSDNMGRLKAYDPAVPDNLHDRAADNWRPLISIADAVGGKWPELARRAAMELSGDNVGDDDSAGVMLLTDLQTIFKKDGSLHIASTDLVEKLVEIEERPWPEWHHQKPITPRQVARLLKPFGVKPTNVRIGSKIPKGYRLEDFNDAFSRYVPITPILSATSATSLKDRGLMENLSATINPDVADKKGDNSLFISCVADVADKSGVLAGVAGNDGMEVFEI